MATYNIHRAIGRDGRRDSARIAAVIRQLRADVIGLQEVDWHAAPDGHDSQFEYLAQLPGYRAVEGPNLRDHRGDYGNVLLTRFPVQRMRRLDLSEPGREPRGAIDADLSLPGGPLRVIVSHFGLGLRERRRQATRIGEELRRRPAQPTVLLGDFNEWLPTSLLLRPLSRLCAPRGHPATYPAAFPLLALDRVLVFGGVSISRVQVLDSSSARVASDHLPVVADIR